ncbi:alpha/beta hydrolase family protein [Clostridium thermarum]|uniref:alpha/beta hydrolase family protein n=2 Tax=Clostridium thermarum TaxID=1716543 RepID=UPI00111DBE90|nr:hypothetical protein [Clostridium thermarum]
MRLLEGILCLLVILFMVIFISGTVRWFKAIKYICLSVLICTILHWIFEGVRWQLYPVYFLVLLIEAVVVLNYWKFTSFERMYTNKGSRFFIIIFITINIIMSLAASYVFPLYNLTKPTGEYKIGTISFDAIDTNRVALYSNSRDANRKIKIQLWYPADEAEGHKRAPWLEGGAVEAGSIAKIVGIPEFLLRPMALIKSNSYKAADIGKAKSKYPLVIISHGLTGLRSLHTDLAELLASHGYIVAGISHTYAAAVTVFDSGEAEYLRKEAIPFGVSREEYLTYSNIVLDTYVQDIQFTIDTLIELNSDKTSILWDKLDLSAIGLLGHSAGGGAGVVTAIKDSRIRAITGFDPWLDPVDAEIINTGLRIPALFLRSEQWITDPNNANLFPLLKSSKGYRELYEISGTTHLDFTMIHMYSPLTKTYGYTGQLDGRKISMIQQDFVLAFFNRYLTYRFDSEDMNSIADKYDEVRRVYFYDN